MAKKKSVKKTIEKTGVVYIVRKGANFDFLGTSYNEGDAFIPPDGYDRDNDQESIISKDVKAICFRSVIQRDEKGDVMAYRRHILPLVEKQER